ncbi:MAG: 2-amino-4-hydroxy-6-hydroxymethyldihydropteridine diphosphokinase [Bacteroidota bacterium]
MIFLGLGSNIGNKVDNLRNSIFQMEESNIHVLRCSAVYRTPAWGIEAQEDFVNAVCEVQFAGTAEELLTALLGIEQMMGRRRIMKWGPRLIDLDILEFHRQQVISEHLTLPHPYYPQRSFVLAPFQDLEPDWIPTGHSLSISTLLLEQADSDITKLSESLIISEQE